MLLASGVKLLDPLKQPLGDINKQAQGGLGSAFGRIKNRATASNRVFNTPGGDYGDERLGKANTLASRGIEDSLYGILGSGSLHDVKAQKDFDRQRALAEEIGNDMKPSVLSQIFGGIGGFANAGLKAAPLFQAFGNRPMRNSPLPSYAMGGYGDEEGWYL